MQHVEVEHVVAAPLQRVWARYTDHRSWNEWAGMGRVRLEREGVPPPNGVGCVRVIGPAGFGAREEVLRFEPPRYMSYRVVSGGLPMKDHLGEVFFEEHPRGTLVRWHCRFRSRIPGLGGAFRLLITTLFRRALANLASEQEGSEAAGKAPS